MRKTLYETYGKRILDFLVSLLAIIGLSPFLLLFTFIGVFKMGGNPFFIQSRPGKDEKIFKLIKFRTMNNRKDQDGNLLPDVQRLTSYGRFLRNSSIDELPELFNILKGDMSIVGPRPLLVKYLPLYNIEQRHRHDVRPGLTGYAQVNGRNGITWEERFRLDVEYTKNITLKGDIEIILKTIIAVLRKDDIDSAQCKQYTIAEFRGTPEE
jgi:undecaprenyl phosphate N,N'-diacetylbacillosamine 1-phosphate transferase